MGRLTLALSESDSDPLSPLFLVSLSIGALCYSFGMFIRLLFRQNTHASGVYIVLYLFTTLAPCAFLAGDYVLLGRIVRHIGMDKHLLMYA